MIRAKNGNHHKCCTCDRTLDPHADAVVYLGWGRRNDGKPGLGSVAALCAPTPGEMSIGSPCVRAAREWAQREGITLIPSDLDGWIGN